MSEKQITTPNHTDTHQDRSNARKENLKELGSMVLGVGFFIGLAGAVIHAGNAMDENEKRKNRKNQAIQASTESLLESSGPTRISLKSGNTVSVQGLDFTQSQIYNAKLNNNGFTKGVKDLYKPFIFSTEKTHESFLLGIERTSNVIETVIDLNPDDDISLLIAATQPVIGVTAQLYYDKENESANLRIIYGDDSPNDDVQFIAMVQEN